MAVSEYSIFSAYVKPLRIDREVGPSYLGPRSHISPAGLRFLMRSLLVFPVLAALTACAAHAESARGSQVWDGLVLQAGTILTQEPGLVFAAGPTLEFTRDHFSGATGILFSPGKLVIHAEARFYPFLWDVARPYVWGGTYKRLGGHGLGVGFDGGIGLAFAIGHLHFSTTLGLERELETVPDEQELFPLLGAGFGWHF